MGNDLVRSGADFAEVSMIPLFVVRHVPPPCEFWYNTATQMKGLDE